MCADANYFFNTETYTKHRKKETRNPVVAEIADHTALEILIC